LLRLARPVSMPKGERLYDNVRSIAGSCSCSSRPSDLTRGPVRRSPVGNSAFNRPLSDQASKCHDPASHLVKPSLINNKHNLGGLDCLLTSIIHLFDLHDCLFSKSFADFRVESMDFVTSWPLPPGQLPNRVLGDSSCLWFIHSCLEMRPLFDQRPSILSP
jgi:hypothetical protein